MARDPNELGAIWISEGRGAGAGRLFFGGAVFEVPEGGITVDLIPFRYQRKDGSGEARGLRVIRVETHQAAPEKTFDPQEELRKAKSAFCGDEAPF